MNLGWKDFYIIITLYIIGIMGMFTLIDITIEKEGTVGVGAGLSFIGAILGGTISGVLTLLGVRLTIKEQRISMAQEKVTYAKYFYHKIEKEINGMIENPHLYTLVDEKDSKRILDIFKRYEHILKETDIVFLEKINEIERFLEEISNIKVVGIEKVYALEKLVGNVASVFRSIEDYFKKFN